MTIAKSFIAVSEHNGIRIPEIFVSDYGQCLTYKYKKKLNKAINCTDLYD
jgi:hypothetical protein